MRRLHCNNVMKSIHHPKDVIYTSKLSSYTISKKRSLNPTYLPQKMAYPWIKVSSILNFMYLMVNSYTITKTWPTRSSTTFWTSHLHFPQHDMHLSHYLKTKVNICKSVLNYLIHPKKHKHVGKHLYFTLWSWRWSCCAVLLWKNNILQKLDFLEKLSYISLMTSFHV